MNKSSFLNIGDAVWNPPLELLITVFSIFWFVWTEDIHKPMVIVDRRTLGMIALFAAMWAVDVLLVKYNRREDEDGDDNGENAGEDA